MAHRPPSMGVDRPSTTTASPGERRRKAHNGQATADRARSRTGPTAPTFAGAVVYFKASNGAGDGGPAWTFRGGGRITDPVPAGRVVYVATFNDQLSALRG
jgi:hypothetical protein